MTSAPTSVPRPVGHGASPSMPSSNARVVQGRRGSILRALVWILHVAVPALVLWLVLAEPDADAHWQHNPSHLSLVLGAAVLSAPLALMIAREGVRRSDGRLALVGLAYMIAAAGLAIHAVATPNEWVDGSTAAFVLATPIALTAAGVVSLWAGSAEHARLLPPANRTFVLVLVALVLGVAASVLTLVDIEPFTRARTTAGVIDEVRILAVISGVAFGLAALGFWVSYRRRSSAVLLGVITANVLLAQAAVAAGWGRNWQISWWTWHLLMVIAFVLVAYVAGIEASRDGSTRSLFQGITMEQTMVGLRDDYGRALESLVVSIETGDRAAVDSDARQLAERFDLSDGQLSVLTRAASAVSVERELQRKLGGLVEAGRVSSVAADEAAMIGSVSERLNASFAPDRVVLWVMRDGQLTNPTGETAPAEIAAGLDGVRTPRPATQLIPFVVRGEPAGVLEVISASTDGLDNDRLNASVAHQVGLSLENARLHAELESMFQTSMSTDVAAELIADPERARLGGDEHEVTILFADLSGFTSYSQRRDPSEVVDMLNDCFALAVPAVTRAGGTVSTFVGDALMAVFGAPAAHSDHADRAVVAALEITRLLDEHAAAHPGHPRFRCGVNTGRALVGNIGSAERRQYTAIGDAVNLAARLESMADVGEVMVSDTTVDQLTPDRFLIRSRGATAVKGRDELIGVYEIRGINLTTGPDDAPGGRSTTRATAHGQQLADPAGVDRR